MTKEKENDELGALVEMAMGHLSTVFKTVKKMAPDIADFCKVMRDELIQREFTREEAMQIITTQLGQMGNK